MQVKILTTKDAAAIAEIAGLQDYRSVARLVASYIEYQPPNSDVTVTISKEMLPDTYKRNPSLLGIYLLSKLSPFFQDSAGAQDHSSEGKNIVIQLFQERKPFNGRWTHAKASAKQLIKEWLELELPPNSKLKIPIDAIAKTYHFYPAQLLHQIYKETNIRIKFTILTKSWLITRK